jgi:hypothetical protein
MAKGTRSKAEWDEGRVDTDEDRSLRGFFSAIRRQRGFTLRFVSAVGLWSALALKDGIYATTLLLGVTAAAVVVIGYPVWRRWGTRTD